MYSFLHCKLSSIIFKVSSTTSWRQIKKLSTHWSSCWSLSTSLASYLSALSSKQSKGYKNTASTMMKLIKFQQVHRTSLTASTFSKAQHEKLIKNIYLFWWHLGVLQDDSHHTNFVILNPRKYDKISTCGQSRCQVSKPKILQLTQIPI